MRMFPSDSPRAISTRYRVPEARTGAHWAERTPLDPRD